MKDEMQEPITMPEFIEARYGVALREEETHEEQARRVLGEEFVKPGQTWAEWIGRLNRSQLKALEEDSMQQVKARAALVRWMQGMGWTLGEEEYETAAESSLEEEDLLERLDEEMAAQGFEVMGEAPCPLTEVRMRVSAD